MTKHKRQFAIGILVLAVLVAILLFVGGGLLAPSEQYSTGKLETTAAAQKMLGSIYTDPTGFTFSPPAKWVHKGAEFTNPLTDYSGSASYEAKIFVNVHHETEYSDITEWVTAFEAYETTRGVSILETKSININGTNAILVTSRVTTRGVPVRGYNLYVLKDQKVYDVNALALDSLWDTYQPLFAAALTTFKVQ